MLTSVGWVGPTKVKGLPSPDKTYPDNTSCPHTRPHTLPDLAKTSLPGRPSDLAATRLSTRPRRRSAIGPLCVMPDLAATRLSGPHVCARPLLAPTPVTQLGLLAAAPTPRCALHRRLLPDTSASSVTSTSYSRDLQPPGAGPSCAQLRCSSP
jgi:hypothetical protein